MTFVWVGGCVRACGCVCVCAVWCVWGCVCFDYEYLPSTHTLLLPGHQGAVADVRALCTKEGYAKACVAVAE
jgi:hypothetical protein